MLVLFGLHTSPCSDICSVSLHHLPRHHVRLWCHLAGGIFGIVSSLWSGLEFLKAWSWVFFFFFCFLWLFPVEVGHCSGTTLGPIHVSGEVWAWENSERQTAGLAEPRGPHATWGSYLLYSTLLGVELELVLAENKCGVTSCSTTGRQPGWPLCVCGWGTICYVG